MPDADARLRAITRFMDDYAKAVPAATVNDRLALYDQLLAQHGCAPRGDTAHYSFPQT